MLHNRSLWAILNTAVCTSPGGFPGGSLVKNSPAKEELQEVTDSILVSGRSPAGGHGNPLQGSCLENPMDRGA